MGNMDIEQRVISVFWNKFQFHAERLSETQKADSLLNPEIGFKAVDLFVGHADEKLDCVMPDML